MAMGWNERWPGTLAGKVRRKSLASQHLTDAAGNVTFSVVTILGPVTTHDSQTTGLA
jgi:hypothetical protein